jgi:hypothetical protein
MRMLLHLVFPHEPFNTLVKKGTAGKIISRILAETKPEASYFTETNGHRCAVLIVNLAEPSQVPILSEPWFLCFNADVEWRIVMTPEDLAKSDLTALGKKWR